jgi:hypothetical protein
MLDECRCVLLPDDRALSDIVLTRSGCSLSGWVPPSSNVASGHVAMTSHPDEVAALTQSAVDAV